MKYFCCDKRRRNAVKDHPILNGIDFLEVVDNVTDAYEDRQTTLLVHFIKDLGGLTLDKSQVIIEGGDRIKNIQVVAVEEGVFSPPIASPPEDAGKVLVVRVSEAGDFSTYTLRLVKDDTTDNPPDGVDPVMASIDFSFKVLCNNDFDCQPVHDCPPGPQQAPEISYLAKDFASFRQLMLDRMALSMPQWTERNPADIGIMLVEVLAYAGDYLSYQQDAVGTEAYLGTARKRISVRRHARLVDYYMHDGCNARTWVHLEIAKGVGVVKIVKGGTAGFLTKGVTDLPVSFRYDAASFETALEENVSVFEPMYDEELRYEHNEMKFYTWGDRDCCLPKGATCATLKGDLTTLKPGQVLIFTEVKGPQTGNAADADPGHRHAVRLTEVMLTYDPLYGSGMGLALTKIKWGTADALPFPLCISVLNGTNFWDEVSVALGNNVLVDHGMSVKDTVNSSLRPDTVEASTMVLAGTGTSGCCEEAASSPLPARFAPVLTRGPLTFAAPYNAGDLSQPAAAAFEWSMRDVGPSILLMEDGTAEKWLPQRDLLESRGNANEFVVEVESDGISHIRFGDDKLGKRPQAGTRFLAAYRVGNGTSGNIGRDAIASVVTNNPDITGGTQTVLSVTNPFAADGGVDPESMERVRQNAPAAFRTQERAVTAGDYEDMALRCSDAIQRAACTFRWTGSWRTAFLTIDRLGGETITTDFEDDIRTKMDRYRMAGQDVEVNGPEYVSLELEMVICVKPNYYPGDVKAALLKIFSNRVLPNGTLGVFHPDNFSFGQPVYLSRLYAAAQAVDGVASVQITQLKRQGDDNNDAVDTGQLSLGRLEIARLDNDPNYPDHGVFTLIMNGGK
ncbi:MAG: putative baseplate assembly protein [Chitinophagaceae bacterium]|nr:putative baseplate assembly protein [Chitinophagaceae bacterium]